jgi:lysozyme family protein
MLEAVFQQVLKWEQEKGVSNDPDDTGGLTNDGITWLHFFTLSKKVLGKEPSLDSFNNLTEKEVRAFYSYSFEQINCHLIADKVVAAVCFDFAKNSLFGKREIQRLLKDSGYNLNADNEFGKISIAAINNATEKLGASVFVKMIFDRREAYVKNIAERKSSQKKFLKGWLHRIADWRNWVELEIEKRHTENVTNPNIS